MIVGANPIGHFMPTVYISGPMRGLPQFNFPAFDEVRDMFLKMGFAVISPADLDRENGINGEDDVPDHNPATFRVFADRDTKAIIGQLKAEFGDFLALLPGWENSTGTFAEVALARMVALPLYEVQYTTTGEPSGWKLIPTEEALDKWSINWITRRGLTRMPVQRKQLA
jgi:hypothetical protein